MKVDKLIGDRFKERPSDCVIDSHALMVKGGYMKYVANGIFSANPPLNRILQKIEQIIREEMDKIDGQEVLFPVVLPAGLWEESGRYESVGSELLRFKDRNQNRMVLGMTHEEAAVHLVREYANGYSKYPFMIYQIQTKFRDEARPRAGLIRVREFKMKDAYSFHTSKEDLEQYYDKCLKAYHRIFARAGIPEVVSIESDSGMMGGAVAHEFMLITPVGEDYVVVCESCDYRSNLEVAPFISDNENSNEAEQELKAVETPDIKSIDDVCKFLKLPVEKSCKAVVYQKKSNNEYVIAFIRGDLELNEVKLTKIVGEEIYPAEITGDSGLVGGFIGPCSLKGNYTVIYDISLKNTVNLACGANEIDKHYTGFNIARDVQDVTYSDISKIKDGSICPNCGKKTVKVTRGIEVGNIFQLGTKYTESMNMQYLDKDGNAQYPIMGCYGIGVGRLAASVCEAKHDDYGPVWPISIAPWQVQLCCVRADDEKVKAYADELYGTLIREKVEVIYDDRDVRAGVMFSDADLIGVPVRIIVSPRNMQDGICEIVTRDKRINRKVPLDEVLVAVKDLIEELQVGISSTADSFG